jgi:hypothetical protein
MDSKKQPMTEDVAGFEYVSASLPMKYRMVRVSRREKGGGAVRPGDMVLLDESAAGSDGTTVAFRAGSKTTFAECVVEDGVWYVRDDDGKLRKASDVIRDGAQYCGTVAHVVPRETS